MRAETWVETSRWLSRADGNHSVLSVAALELVPTVLF